MSHRLMLHELLQQEHLCAYYQWTELMMTMPFADESPA
jgi:hypothetical protein